MVDRRITRVGRLAVALLALAACADPGGPDSASVAPVSGDAQAGEAGSVLADSLVVVVRDGGGRVVAGASVAWQAVVGGGAVSPAASVTDADGRARAARTLGPVTGLQTTRATVDGLAPAVFSALARIQGGVSMGNRTIGPLADTVLGTNHQPLVVMVVDEDGVPVPGVVVTWSAAGGGSVSATSMPTDAGGESAVTYTYGAVSGPHHAAAAVPGMIGSPIDFALNATAASAVSLEKSGADSLVVAPGGDVVYSVRTRDAHGNPRGGVVIGWQIGLGGGSITPPENITVFGGVATATRTLGADPGPQTATATALEIPAAPHVTFTTNPATPPGTRRRTTHEP